MEHIVQFAIGIDDDAIRKRVVESGEKQIIDSIAADVRKQIFRKDPWSRGKEEEFTIYADRKIEDILNSWKDEIVDAAAEKLADRLMRTKRVKEAVDNVIATDGES